MKPLDEEQIEAIEAVMKKHVGKFDVVANAIAELSEPPFTPKMETYVVTTGKGRPIKLTSEILLKNVVASGGWRYPTATEIGLEPFAFLKVGIGEVKDEYYRGHCEAIDHVNQSLFPNKK